MTGRCMRKPNCETIVLDDETMILDPAGMTVTRINEVGLFCWVLLEEPRSPESLTLAVRECYEAAEADAERDVAEFLRQLRDCGLLEAV